MKYALFLFLTLMCCNAVAQRYDYTWLAGYGSKDGVVDSNNIFGITKFNFASGSIGTSYDSLGMEFDMAICSMSDRDGNLLFYSNGNYIANQWDEMIENSDSLCAGYVTYVEDPSIALYGQRFSRQIMALSNPGDRNAYLMFHLIVDSVYKLSGSYSITSKKLLLNKLRFQRPMNKGAMEVRQEVLIDTLPSLAMAANQHANGRDWWLIGQLSRTTKFYRILISPERIERLPDIDVAVHKKDEGEVGASTFSSDGTKYADLTGYYGLSIYDFDRCDGTLSNRIDIPLPEIKAEILIGISVSFSPNSRFLYVGATDRIYQYDMWAADIPASQYRVATYDGFYDSHPALKTYFANSQLGPDGRIYYATGNTTKYYHVIEKPDELRDSCLVRQHSLKLKAHANGIPYYPNYRLGALAGSPCDTLPKQVGIGEVEGEPSALRVYPMPAQTKVTIDYAELPWSRYHNVRLEITDALGRTVYDEDLPKYSAYQRVDVSGFAAGSYMVVLRDGSSVVGSGKMVKQ